jgi:hypothetical protein
MTAQPPRCAACNGIVKEDGQAYDWTLTPEHPGRFNNAPWLGWRCTRCGRKFPAKTDFDAHECTEVTP